MCSEGWGRRSKLRRKARKVGEGVSLPDKERKRALWRRASQCHGKKDQERRTGRVSYGFGKRGHWWHY